MATDRRRDRARYPRALPPARISRPDEEEGPLPESSLLFAPVRVASLLRAPVAQPMLVALTLWFRVSGRAWPCALRRLRRRLTESATLTATKPVAMGLSIRAAVPAGSSARSASCFAFRRWLAHDTPQGSRQRPRKSALR